VDAEVKKGDYPYPSTHQLTLYNTYVAPTNRADITFYWPMSQFLMDFVLAMVSMEKETPSIVQSME
jgi:hypothetical protein